MIEMKRTEIRFFNKNHTKLANYSQVFFINSYRFIVTMGDNLASFGYNMMINVTDMSDNKNKEVCNMWFSSIPTTHHCFRIISDYISLMK